MPEHEGSSRIKLSLSLCRLPSVFIKDMLNETAQVIEAVYIEQFAPFLFVFKILHNYSHDVNHSLTMMTRTIYLAFIFDLIKVDRLKNTIISRTIVAT